MKLTEAVVALTLVMASAGTAVVVADLPGQLDHPAALASAIRCRAVTDAAAAYSAEHRTPAAQINDLDGYLGQTASDYRIIDGVIVGPGCTPTRSAP